MGKGNRNRQNAARDVLAGAGTRTAGKKQSNYKTWVGTLIVTVVLLALVAVVFVSAMNSNGMFTRHRVMVSSENYDITVAGMSYLVYTQYQNFVDTYQNSGYMAYIRGSGGTGLSTSTPLRQQNYSVTTDEITGETVTVTWFDYFAKSALASSKEILSLCEGARHYGITLSEEDEANIDLTLETLKYYGEITGYGTNGYLRNLYGKGVRLSDVRYMLELTTLASKYLEIGQEQADNSVTDVMIDQHYTENVGTYENCIDYISAEFLTKFKPASDTADDPAAENAANYVTYQTEQQKYQDRVDALAACADEDAFKTLLRTYIREDVAAENEGAEEDEIDEQTDELLASCIHTDATQSDVSDSDANAWLFGATARNTGDTTTFTDPGEVYDEEEGIYNEAESEYKVLMVTAGMHTDTAVVRSVGHILFKADSYLNVTSPDQLTGKLKELAERLIERDSEAIISAAALSRELLTELFEEGKITERDGRYFIDEAVFEEYGKIFNEDSNIFYNDVKVGDMVEEFNDWIFDAGRVEGEISYPTAVQTTYGSHIMYYRGNEQPAWRAEVREELSDSAYTAWKEKADAAYEATESEKIEGLWSHVGV